MLPDQILFCTPIQGPVPGADRILVEIVKLPCVIWALRDWPGIHRYREVTLIVHKDENPAALLTVNTIIFIRIFETRQLHEPTTGMKQIRYCH